MSRLPATPDLSADEMEADRQAVEYYCWEIFRKTEEVMEYIAVMLRLCLLWCIVRRVIRTMQTNDDDANQEVYKRNRIGWFRYILLVIKQELISARRRIESNHEDYIECVISITK